VPGFGARTIPPAWPDPFLADQRWRWHELAVIHDSRTDPATQLALLTRYHARWVLEVPGSWTISAGQTPVAVGPQGQRLYRVPGAPG
jgi:alpha-1,6-mannosyltransferase